MEDFDRLSSNDFMGCVEVPLSTLADKEPITQWFELQEKKSDKEFVAKSVVRVSVRAAEGLLAADRGGTSDPYAEAELVVLDTGKPIKKTRKTKTKTIKKTLDPVWNSEEFVWRDIPEAPDTLGLRVRVYDKDMLTSDALGEATIPLAECSGSEEEDDIIKVFCEPCMLVLYAVVFYFYT